MTNALLHQDVQVLLTFSGVGMAKKLLNKDIPPFKEKLFKLFKGKSRFEKFCATLSMNSKYHF
jgi:hypothetical protein